MEKDWVCVLETEQMYQAEIARELLDNEGIESVVFNEHDSTFPSIGDVQVWVHQDYQKQALEILKDILR